MDEPFSGLDPLIRRQMRGELASLQEEIQKTIIFITHDFGIVAKMCDRVAVMYAGKIVEQGDVRQIFNNPQHPYTEALLSAVPIADPDIVKEHIILEGDIPSALNPPSGCPFHTRCHRKIEGLCDYEIPPLKHLSSGHDISCHLTDEDLNSMAPVFRSGKKAAA